MICDNEHNISLIQGGFFSGTTQFQYQKENRQPANQSCCSCNPVTKKDHEWLLILLVLKSGGTSDKTALYVGSGKWPPRIVSLPLAADQRLSWKLV